MTYIIFKVFGWTIIGNMENFTTLQNLSSGSLQKLNFFDGIPREELLYLLRNTSVEEIRVGDIVFQEGEPADFFVLIMDGFFKLVRELNDNRKHLVLDFVSAGDMVAGLLMVDSQSKFLGSLKALEAGHVFRIPRSTYLSYWSGNPEILQRLQKANLNRMRSLQLLREAGAYPIEKRLAWTVIKYLKKLSNAEGLVAINFSRKDLGELVNTTPESVMRVLSQWKKEELLVLKDNLEFFESENLERKYFAKTTSIFPGDY